MNEMNKKLIEGFGRITNFGAENSAEINVNTPAKNAFKVIKDGLAALEAQGITRTSAETTKFNKTAERGALRNQLIDDLQDMAKIARLLAKKNPFYENKFRMPRGNKTDLNLLETVRTWISDASGVTDDFTTYGLPADFFEDLAADADRFEQIIEEQDSANRERVGATASIDEILDEMLEAKRVLDVIVPRIFRNDSGKLSQWFSASRIERSKKTRKTPDLQTPDVK